MILGSMMESRGSYRFFRPYHSNVVTPISVEVNFSTFAAELRGGYTSAILHMFGAGGGGGAGGQRVSQGPTGAGGGGGAGEYRSVVLNLAEAVSEEYLLSFTAGKGGVKGPWGDTTQAGYRGGSSLLTVTSQGVEVLDAEIQGGAGGGRGGAYISSGTHAYATTRPGGGGGGGGGGNGATIPLAGRLGGDSGTNPAPGGAGSKSGTIQKGGNGGSASGVRNSSTPNARNGQNAIAASTGVYLGWACGGSGGGAGEDAVLSANTGSGDGGEAMGGGKDEGFLAEYSSPFFALGGAGGRSVNLHSLFVDLMPYAISPDYDGRINPQKVQDWENPSVYGPVPMGAGGFGGNGAWNTGNTGPSQGADGSHGNLMIEFR